jgi:hypothetical protein
MAGKLIWNYDRKADTSLHDMKQLKGPSDAIRALRVTESCSRDLNYTDEV